MDLKKFKNFTKSNEKTDKMNFMVLINILNI